MLITIFHWLIQDAKHILFAIAGGLHTALTVYLYLSKGKEEHSITNVILEAGSFLLSLIKPKKKDDTLYIK